MTKVQMTLTDIMKLPENERPKEAKCIRIPHAVLGSDYIIAELSIDHIAGNSIFEFDEVVIPHVHCSLIKKWADGAVIQYYCHVWHDCGKLDPRWSPETKYRVKPWDV